MIIIMNADATAENIKDVIEVIQNAGLSAQVMEGSEQRIVGVIGDKARLGSLAVMSEIFPSCMVTQNRAVLVFATSLSSYSNPVSSNTFFKV